MKFQNFNSRQCVQSDFCFISQAIFIYIFAYTTASITTHHRFRTVCIENTHTEISLIRVSDQYKSVTPNSCMELAPFDCFLFRSCYRIVGSVYIYVVISCSMHFSELNLFCHFDLYLLVVVSFCFITTQRYDFLLYVLLKYISNLYLFYVNFQLFRI